MQAHTVAFSSIFQRKMRISRLLWLVISTIFIFGIEGCTHFNEIRETTDERAGSFQTLDEMLAATSALQIGVTTCPDGLKEAKFDPAMKNTKTLPGAQGKDYIMGPNSQLLASSPEAIDAAVTVLDTYVVHLYPFRYFTKIEPYVWFYKKDVVIKAPEKENVSGGKQNTSDEQKAADGELIIKCKLNNKNEKVVTSYSWKGTQDVYRKELKEQPGGSALPWLLGGAAGGALFGFTK